MSSKQRVPEDQHAYSHFSSKFRQTCPPRPISVHQDSHQRLTSVRVLYTYRTTSLWCSWYKIRPMRCMRYSSCCCTISSLNYSVEYIRNDCSQNLQQYHMSGKKVWSAGVMENIYIYYMTSTMYPAVESSSSNHTNVERNRWDKQGGSNVERSPIDRLSRHRASCCLSSRNTYSIMLLL